MAYFDATYFDPAYFDTDVAPPVGSNQTFGDKRVYGKPVGYYQLTLNTGVAVNLNTACSGAAALNANAITIAAEVAPVRVRTDGVAPTASVGSPFYDGNPELPVYDGPVLNAAVLANIKIIETANATVNLNFYQVPRVDKEF